VANGNDLNTQPGSIYGKLGVNVRFVIQDDIPTLATIFESGAAQCALADFGFLGAGAAQPA
jgi:NitT/TauT family transport system substrate-binding protein